MSKHAKHRATREPLLITLSQELRTLTNYWRHFAKPTITKFLKGNK